MNKIEHFFKLHKMKPQDIIYIVREDGKTAIYLFDGRVVRTYNTVKSIFDELPQGAFLNINKGVIVAVTQVKEIRDGVYEMNDGRVFQGRVRNGSQHKKNSSLVEMRLQPIFKADPSCLQEQFLVLADLPMPFFAVEAVYNSRSRKVEYSLRYVNAAGEKFCGQTLDTLKNGSLSEVFREKDPRLLSTCSEIALNGSRRVLKDYAFARGKKVDLHCYCPASGYCGIVIPSVLTLD